MKERAKCIRFEIEYADGTVARAVSPEAAERHHRDLDAACSLATVHGWSPAAPPEFETVPASRAAPLDPPDAGQGTRDEAKARGLEAILRALVPMERTQTCDFRVPRRVVADVLRSLSADMAAQCDAPPPPPSLAPRDPCPHYWGGHGSCLLSAGHRGPHEYPGACPACCHPWGGHYDRNGQHHKCACGCVASRSMIALAAPSPLSAAPRCTCRMPVTLTPPLRFALPDPGCPKHRGTPSPPSASETTPATHFGGVGRFLAADSARLTREARASVALDGETHCVDEPSLRGEGTSGTAGEGEAAQ